MKILQATRRNFRRKMDQDTITGAELLAGIRQCFFLTQREFHTKRQDDSVTTNDIRVRCYNIVNDSYRRSGVHSQKIIVQALRYLVDGLSSQFDFVQDEDLSDTHKEVVNTLIAKYEAGARN